MQLPSMRLRRTVNPPEPAGNLAATLFIASGAGIALLVLASRWIEISLSPSMWYVTRAAGLTLYLLLWFTVLSGLGLTTRALDRFSARSTIYSLHSYATRLSFGFLALHLITLAANPYDRYTFNQLFVPFQSGWAEPWTGLGVIAMYLMLLTGLTFGIRRLTGFRVWRWLHYLTFPLYVMALAHGLGSGTDSSVIAIQLAYVLSALPIAALTMVRLAAGGRKSGMAVPEVAPGYDRLLVRANRARLRPALLRRGQQPFRPERANRHAA